MLAGSLKPQAHKYSHGQLPVFCRVHFWCSSSSLFVSLFFAGKWPPPLFVQSDCLPFFLPQSAAWLPWQWFPLIGRTAYVRLQYTRTVGFSLFSWIMCVGFFYSYTTVGFNELSLCLVKDFDGQRWRTVMFLYLFAQFTTLHYCCHTAFLLMYHKSTVVNQLPPEGNFY